MTIMTRHSNHLIILIAYPDNGNRTVRPFLLMLRRNLTSMLRRNSKLTRLPYRRRVVLTNRRRILAKHVCIMLLSHKSIIRQTFPLIVFLLIRTVHRLNIVL